MPPKKMLQYQCDRCPSVWYSEENKPEPPCAVEVKADFGDGGAVLRAKFECLCPSCRQTVHALVKQISRTLQKVSSIRVAKKKDKVAGEAADKASASSADPSTQSTPMKVPDPTAVAVPAAAEASTPVRQTPSVPSPAATGASAGKAPQVIATHPKR